LEKSKFLYLLFVGIKVVLFIFQKKQKITKNKNKKVFKNVTEELLGSDSSL
jgi:hypothetical protein